MIFVNYFLDLIVSFVFSDVILILIMCTCFVYRYMCNEINALVLWNFCFSWGLGFGSSRKEH